MILEFSIKQLLFYLGLPDIKLSWPTRHYASHWLSITLYPVHHRYHRIIIIIIIVIIIQCIFSFLFIGQELSMWPANNCLQINILLQITFCSCVIETKHLCENGRSFHWAGREWCDVFSWSKEQWSNDKTIIIELGYCKISWLSASIIYLSLLLRQIIDLLATDKSWYFAQPHSIIIIVKYCRWIAQLVYLLYKSQSTK